MPLKIRMSRKWSVEFRRFPEMPGKIADWYLSLGFVRLTKTPSKWKSEGPNRPAEPMRDGSAKDDAARNESVQGEPPEPLK